MKIWVARVIAIVSMAVMVVALFSFASNITSPVDVFGVIAGVGFVVVGLVVTAKSGLFSKALR